jgi:hypothetical protein
MDNKKQLMILALCGMVSVAQAGEKEELLKLRNTTINLIKQLVKQGVLTDQVANDMIKQAEADAQSQAEQQAARQDVAPESGEVRVPYVPDFVKDEIRQQVRAELREDVVGDVMQKAKTQKWGMPEALPEWISRFKISGDLRLRSQTALMATDNIQGSYFDYQSINDLGGITNAGINAFYNTTQDSQSFRDRLRLSIDAKIAENLKAGIRLATGNIRNPISTNQTLGNTGAKQEFNIDRAYLKYDGINDEGFKWLTLAGGRIQNPWFVGGGEFTGGSELVWDTDLSFEGAAGTIRHRLGGSDSLYALKDDSRSVFATVGAFPLQESALSSNDKWLFGGQVGLDWGFSNQDALKFGVAYYDYVNIEAKPNQNPLNTCDTNSFDNNSSAPQFMTLGNTVAEICREGTINNPGVFSGLVGLASDYNIINTVASYDMAKFAPIHVVLSADYAKNIGFNGKDVQKLTGAPVSDETNAWQMRVDVGWPRVDRPGNWSAFALYKYLERDSVLDAFTDSDFHLGGTNSKGWVIGGNYGLMKNVWMTGRWLSADIITGPPLGIDLLQVDINTRF